ncbi:MAG: PilZ domain-containing protein [Aestuariibacter sp.]
MTAAVSSQQVHGDFISQVLPGCKMKLEFTGGDLPRIPAMLVGYEIGKYIIVRLEENSYWSRYADFLLPNNKLIARLVLENRYGECIAFRTMVRWQGHHPLDFLYLSFPELIQKVDLRAHTRIPTCIKAVLSDSLKIASKGREIVGHISDVSLGGCKFEFDLPQNRIGVSPRPVQIAAGKNLLLKGDIKNQRPAQQNRIAVGMQFLTSEKETKKLLSALYVAPEMLTAC